MFDLVSRWLFNPSGLSPHGFCLLWEPGLIWTHAVSDSVIGLAYFTIPVALIVVARRRSDLVFRPVFWLFAAFILLCGTGHWLDLLTIWVPAYGISGVVKAATAAVSAIGAVTLWLLLPKVLALPSPAQLREADSALRESEAKFRLLAEQLARRNADLELSRGQFDVAIDNMSQGLTFFDRDGRLLVCNRRYREIYRLSPVQASPGTTLLELLYHRIGNACVPDMSRSDFIARWKALVVAQEPRDMIDELQDGRTISMHFQPLPAGGWVTTHEDVTERSRAEARSLFMARHDALTGLPNRVMFYERLEKAARSAGRGHGWAVLCLDLDHFKLVNDTLGHPVGDGLLRAAADRLRACVREADTVARLNGDEFAIIQHGVQGPVDVELLAGRILAVFSTPFNIDGHDIVVGISIGITVAPEDGIASDKLLKNAGIALYLAKLESRGTVRYFEPEMNARIQRRRLLELDLRGAVERNEFALYYQPLINLATDGVAGFEALIRWHHPVRGVVPPSDFIPLAEETGLIVAIGDWALRAACLEAATWPDDISVAVNLSSIQFKRGDLVTSVRAALAASGLSPERLELEITESVLLLDSDATLAVLHALHAMGIVVALDDFGTGYSSLSYLRSFPFGKIKIDQSFVRDMLCNKESVSIIRAVTGLGQSLSMKTTAEGVETQAQLDRLRQEGCTEVQGYFFSRPKPADEVPMMIQTLRQDASRAAVQVVPSLDSVPAE